MPPLSCSIHLWIPAVLALSREGGRVNYLFSYWGLLENPRIQGVSLSGFWIFQIMTSSSQDQDFRLDPGSTEPTKRSCASAAPFQSSPGSKATTICMVMFGQKGQLLGDTLAPPELQHPPLDTCSSSQLECVGQCVANKRDRVGRERAEPWVECIYGGTEKPHLMRWG